MNIRDDIVIKKLSQGYLVGGYLRDFLMNKIPSSDRDITIADAEKFAHRLADELDATFVTLDPENKIYRLVLKDKINYFDISELRGKTIEDDLSERDFTINAVAYDLSEDKFIDTTGGIDDIKKGLIKGIQEKNFIDDPLRIIRAYRFMSTTGFDIDIETKKILKKHKQLINLSAKERVHDEIMKLFGGKYASKALLQMYDDKVLELIFVSVKEMEFVIPNTHHHLDLIHHVIETVRQVEIQYETASDVIKSHLDKIDFGGYPRINHLKLAAFLHDVGKFSTWTLQRDNNVLWSISEGLPCPKIANTRHRFIKHDVYGAKMLQPILKELKFSNKQIEYICEIVKNHIYPSSVISSPVLDSKTMMRYVRKMGENSIDEIILAKADRLSAQGVDVTREMIEKNINGLNKLLDFYIEIQPLLKPLPKILSGTEIMQILGIKQSPVLGKIIKELKEAQINGDVVTKEDAVEFVKRFYKSV